MELNETIEMMISPSYKKRFKAEYFQLFIRYNKLNDMLDKWDKGKLNFTPICPKNFLELQSKIMREYLTLLEARAIIEGVELK